VKQNIIKPDVGCGEVLLLVCEPREPPDAVLFIGIGRLENRGGNFRGTGAGAAMCFPGGLFVVWPRRPPLTCRC